MDEATRKEWDLTPTIGRFLDRHLIIPLLDFLAKREFFSSEDLGKAKLAVLFKTNMLDYAIEIHQDLHKQQEVPANMTARKQEVLANMTALKDEVGPILELLQDQGRVAELKHERCFTQAYLQQQLGITPQHVEVLRRYAKFSFECGSYAEAAYLLANYRLLTLDADKSFSALWGKLASEILNQSWDAALDDLHALRDAIDSRTSTPAAMQLQQRCWVMHWALFLLGNHPNGKSVVADLFFQEKYMQAIQTNAPHLLRYLAVAVVTNPRRRDKARDLVRIIGMERSNFSDPVTRFLEDLHTHANFEDAQERLKECAALLDQDFFLCNAEEPFLKAARLSIFESYCRIHERINLEMLAEKLGMELIAAEKWIVQMVADAQLNAKIDSQSGHVILGVQPPDVYQQVIEKTKGLSFRSYVLAQNIEKRSSAVAAAD